MHLLLARMVEALRCHIWLDHEPKLQATHKRPRWIFTKRLMAQVTELVHAGNPVTEIAREFEINGGLARSLARGAEATQPAAPDP